MKNGMNRLASKTVITLGSLAITIAPHFASLASVPAEGTFAVAAICVAQSASKKSPAPETKEKTAKQPPSAGQEPKSDQPEKSNLPAAARLDPEIVWDRHFEKNKETSESIRAALEVLVRSKKLDHAVAMLRAAMKRGLAEPWMYEALAIMLEATDASREEIERTLLSAADVTSDSPEAQYRVAQSLTRHGLKEAAIRLYRVAAEKAPFAAEPYVESLDLAVEMGDVRTVSWAVSHLLGQGWPHFEAELHKKARAKATEMESQLRRDGRKEEAEQLAEQVRLAETRDLVVRVTWQGEADIDLKVLEPLGSVCSAQNRMTPAGGVLVQDAFGKDAGSAKNPAEVYVCARGLPGSYQIRLDRVWGSPLGGRAKVEVTQYQGTADEKRETFYVAMASTKPLVVNLEKGRRSELLAIPQIAPPEIPIATLKLPIQQVQEMADYTGGKPYGGPQQLFQFGAVTGGGAVAFNPTVTQFFFGAGFAAQAVVSADRRYVRISIAPSFTALAGERRFMVTGAAGGGGFRP